MIDPQYLLAASALSVLLVAVLVAARLAWSLVAALRSRRYKIVAVSVVGVMCMVALLATLLIVWFGYAVAHIEKNTKTDLTVLFFTASPYFGASLGLWLLGGKLHSRLQSRHTQQDISRDGSC